MSVEHVLKNIRYHIYYVSLLVLLANVVFNSLKLDISRGVLDGVLNITESVSEGFPSYSNLIYSFQPALTWSCC